MLTTKVINGTGKDLILKEGTAGVKRILKKLPATKSYTISVDANATYREYWCAEKNDDPNAVVLSSDDCQEFQEVTILVRVETDTSTGKKSEIYSWEGLKRDTGEKVKVSDGVKIPVPGNTARKGWLKRFTEFFRGESSNVNADADADVKTGNSHVAV